MKVRKTSGKLAGLVVDLPDDAAEAELAFGTAERVEEVVVPVSEPEPGPEKKKVSKKKVVAKKKKRSKKSAR